MSAICEDSNCGNDRDHVAAEIGLGVMAAGAIATPIGWTMFAHNRTRLRLLGQGGLGWAAARVSNAPALHFYGGGPVCE